MKIEDIYKEWSKDQEIKIEQLTRETTQIPYLHNKYYNMYIEEGLRLKKMRIDLKKLRYDRYNWYLGDDISKETITSYGWKPAPDKTYRKQEALDVVEVDQIIIEETLRVYVQEEKVKYLENIIKMIGNRGFQIKSIIDWEKFTAGA